MDITIQPGTLAGIVTVPPSKSVAHRMLICAAFAQQETTLSCPQSGEDLLATMDCLRALGADVTVEKGFIHIRPIRKTTPQATLPCKESGTTLRFFLPIVGALGVDATFVLEGRLSQRPLSPLWEEMERMGCALSRPTEHTLRCTGKLRPGNYCIPGNISSQFLSGLAFALPLIQGHTSLSVLGQAESQPYYAMTQQILEMFHYPGKQIPRNIPVEGDWSSAAFWHCANALGSKIHIEGLQTPSVQGDSAIVDLLWALEENLTLSARDIPDLIPALAVVAAAKKGAVFTDIQRLRLKESDRVNAIIQLLQNLGGKAKATENTLTVHGTGLLGGTVHSFHDHRIAMAAAIAATVCTQPVTILQAKCVKKSYPAFWDHYTALGGKLWQTSMENA